MANDSYIDISKSEMITALREGKKTARYDDGPHEFYILVENILKDEHGRTLSTDVDAYFSDAPKIGWVER